MDRFMRVLSPNRSKAPSAQDSARTHGRGPFQAQSDPIAAVIALPLDEPATTRKARRVSSAIYQRLREERVEAAARSARPRVPITVRAATPG